MTQTIESLHEELQKISVEAKKTLDGLNKRDAAVSEIKEAQDKIKTDLDEVLEKMRKFEATPAPRYSEVDGKSVVKQIRNLGVKSFDEIRSLPRYEGTGKVSTWTELYDNEVAGTLKMIDDCYMAHSLAMLCNLGGGKYEHMVHRQGARAALKAYFPVLGGQLDDFSREFADIIQKADGDQLETDVASYGLEWVPEGWASSLLVDARLNLPVLALFSRFNQPNKVFNWPLLAGEGTAYLRSEVSNATKSNLTTGKRQWTAATFASYQAMSTEIDQDSIIAILPEMRSAISRNLGEGLELAIVNGDTTATHMDDDIADAVTGGAQRVEQAFDGLRHYALVSPGSLTVDAGADALAAADVLAAAGLMGKYFAGRPGDCVLLINTESYIDLLADTKLETVDKYGPSATIVTGELGKVYGIPVLLSYGIENRKNNTASTGVNTNAGPNTLSTAVLVNRQMYKIGDRQDVRFETDKNIVNGITDIVATARWSFNYTIGGSGKPHTTAIINIAD